MSTMDIKFQVYCFVKEYSESCLPELEQFRVPVLSAKFLWIFARQNHDFLPAA